MLLKLNIFYCYYLINNNKTCAHTIIHKLSMNVFSHALVENIGSFPYIKYIKIKKRLNKIKLVSLVLDYFCRQN